MPIDVNSVNFLAEKVEKLQGKESDLLMIPHIPDNNTCADLFSRANQSLEQILAVRLAEVSERARRKNIFSNQIDEPHEFESSAGDISQSKTRLSPTLDASISPH